MTRCARHARSAPTPGPAPPEPPPQPPRGSGRAGKDRLRVVDNRCGGSRESSPRPAAHHLLAVRSNYDARRARLVMRGTEKVELCQIDSKPVAGPPTELRRAGTYPQSVTDSSPRSSV